MPRSVTISIPPDRSGALVDDLSSLEGVVSLSRQRRASIIPPGDLVSVDVVNSSMPPLFDLLSRYGAGTDDAVSVSTTEPLAVVSASSSSALARDPATSSLEEVEATLERESNMRANKVTAMATAGAIAAVGLVTGSVHVVVGAMVIAPGFEPFVKVALRVTGRGRSFGRAFADIAVGWSALFAGALAGALVLRALGVSATTPSAGYLAGSDLLTYWRDLTGSATVIAVLASVAGTVLVAASRAVLTGGVMIALALVPGAALGAIGLADGDLGLAADGALRWAHDAAVVTAVATAVLAGYRRARGRRLDGAAAAAGITNRGGPPGGDDAPRGAAGRARRG
ncbi:MAG: DUF389 domain-containing protein [Actinomycetes bacterium]